MTEPPPEMMGGGRRVGRPSGRENEKTKGKVNGAPAVRQTYNGTAGRLVAVRHALSRDQWNRLLRLLSPDRRWTA
jgi:hypothetical protein